MATFTKNGKTINTDHPVEKVRLRSSGWAEKQSTPAPTPAPRPVTPAVAKSDD